MNVNDDDSPLRDAAPSRLDAVDETWIETALDEVVGEDAPPDLRARVLAAAPAQAAAAAARVEFAARRPHALGWAAAAMLLGALVVGGVLWSSRSATEGAAAGPAQGPAQEIKVSDVAHLARHLAATTTLALRVVHGPDGARLPDEAEYSAMIHGIVPLQQLRDAVTAASSIGEPFAVRETSAELHLHGEAGFVRLRLRIDADAVRVGTAEFACADSLPPPLARTLRSEWRILAAQKPPARQRIQVHTQRQLVEAIGSDRTIELIGGPFVLTGSDERGDLPQNPAVEFREASPVPFLVVKGVRNLQLRAIGGAVRVLGRSPADVLRCEECEDVLFEGLVLGHDTGVERSCSAPVLTLSRCRNVRVRDCELFGCGTEGIVADDVQGFRMERGEIHTCLHGVVRFTASREVIFSGARFRDCGITEAAFAFLDCEHVHFADCAIRGMASMNRPADDDGLFAVRMDEPVAFVRGSIRGNRTSRVANSKLLLVRDRTDEGDNGPDVQPARTDR